MTVLARGLLPLVICDKVLGPSLPEGPVGPKPPLVHGERRSPDTGEGLDSILKRSSATTSNRKWSANRGVVIHRLLIGVCGETLIAAEKRLPPGLGGTY